MKSGKLLSALLLIYGLAGGVASADVLILKNGQAISGKFQGATQTTVEFLTDGQVRQYRIADVNSITLTGTGTAGTTKAGRKRAATSTGTARASTA